MPNVSNLIKPDVSLGFVLAEVVEKTTKYQAQLATANMTRLVKEVELSIPQSTTLATYLAELISALSSNACSALQEFIYIERVSFLENPSTASLRLSKVTLFSF